MSTAQSPDFSPPIINGIYEVAGHHMGRSLVDVVRNCFTGGKVRNGDYFVGRSRPLLEQYYPVLPGDDLNAIQNQYRMALGAREKMENARGLRKFLKAKKYEEVARYLFIIVETASRRAANQNLLAQISEAMVGGAPQLPPFGTTTTLSNPFSDSHETSSLSDVDLADVNVGNLNQVEMSVFRFEATGEPAIVLGLHGQDGTTQEVAGTIPLAVGSDYRTDEGAETATVSTYTSLAILGPPGAGGDVRR